MSTRLQRPEAPRPKVSEVVARADGWINLLTALGTSGDKRTHAKVKRLRLAVHALEEFWQADALARRIVEKIPSIELQRGFRVQVGSIAARKPTTFEQLVEDDAGEYSAATLPAEGDELKQATEGINSRIDELGARQVFRKARQYERGYGGAAVMLFARDGVADWSKPLNELQLQQLDGLDVLRPIEFWPARWLRNPMQPGYGTPLTYWVQRETEGGSSLAPQMQVHRSRLILFEGFSVSKPQRAVNRGVGDSVLLQCMETVRDWWQGGSNASALIEDFSQAVWGVKNLAELLTAEDGEQVAARRYRVLNRSRSVTRAAMIDKEETFERKSTPVSGLPDLLDRLDNRLAAVADIPVTILFGQAPAGLNANGASDVRAWYDTVESERDYTLTPALKRFVRVLFLEKRGVMRGVEPERWSVCYPPMWRPTPSEKADIKLKQSQTDKNEIDSQMVTPEEAAVSRHGGDEWSDETHLDQSTRDIQSRAEARLSQEADAQKAALEQQQAKGAPPAGGGPGGGKTPAGYHWVFGKLVADKAE